MLDNKKIMLHANWKYMYWNNKTYFADMFRQVLADDEAGVSQALATEWVDGLHPQSDGVCSCHIWDN